MCVVLVALCILLLCVLYKWRCVFYLYSRCNSNRGVEVVLYVFELEAFFHTTVTDIGLDNVTKAH